MTHLQFLQALNLALGLQVKNAAVKALTAASAAMGNKDIENLVPAVISAMANPSQVRLTLAAHSHFSQAAANFWA